MIIVGMFQIFIHKFSFGWFMNILWGIFAKYRFNVLSLS